MEKVIENFIGWFGFVGIILVLFCTNVVVISSLIICWTILIIYMIGKIVNKSDEIGM